MRENQDDTLPSPELSPSGRGNSRETLMQAVFFLIPLALIFCALMVKAFFWAVSHRQFDNLDAAARSILFDEDERTGVNAQSADDTASPPPDTDTPTERQRRTPS